MQWYLSITNPSSYERLLIGFSEWQECKLPNCERFQLSSQTSDGLMRTLRCQAALIEDLLETQQYEYVLTARFQSDPLEKRYGQCWQMSGGRFLVSLREVRSSEKILKLKSLIKAGCDFADAQSDDSSKTQIEISRTIKREIEKMPIDNLVLDENSKEVATYVAGFIAKQTIPYTKDCCAHLLVGESEDDIYSADEQRRSTIPIPSPVWLCLFFVCCTGCNKFNLHEVSP